MSEKPEIKTHPHWLLYCRSVTSITSPSLRFCIDRCSVAGTTLSLHYTHNMIQPLPLYRRPWVIEMRRSFQFLSVYTKDKLLFGLYISLRVVLQCKRTKVFSAGFSHPGDHTIYSVSNSPPNSTQYSLHQGRLRVCFKWSSVKHYATLRR